MSGEIIAFIFENRYQIWL